jgi:ligand-binding SRPBCC domain-containing protein
LDRQGGPSNMPLYSTSIDIKRPVDEVFAFFTRPANLVQLAPPDFHLELQEGPDVLKLGSRLTWKGRRWGIAQKIIQEVTQFETGKLIFEEQRQGPFARWVNLHHFTASETGALIREEIHFDPPGGLVGLMITADFVRKDLDKLFAFREAKLKELFGA